MIADLIFTAGSVCFSIALLPMVRGTHKPAFLSSVMTGGWLWAFAATYVTLGLVFSAISTAVSAALWTVLAIQVLTKERNVETHTC